jgi:hypothetical protein
MFNIFQILANQNKTTPINPPMAPNDYLYEAIANAETGGIKDPFIRTKYAPEQGSTAYGPVQLTRGLAKGYLDTQSDMFDEDEKQYLQRFVQQGDLFARYGKEPSKAGYDPRYDYGGTGILNTDEDKEMYKQVTEKMLREIYDRHDGDIEKTWQEWRFGPKGGQDKRYKQAFYQKLSASKPDNMTMKEWIDF